MHRHLGMFEVQCPEKSRQTWELFWSQQIDHMQELGNAYAIFFLRLETRTWQF